MTLKPVGQPGKAELALLTLGMAVVDLGPS